MKITTIKFFSFLRRLLKDEPPDKLKVSVSALERELTAEDINTNLPGCIGCNNCATACSWFVATNDIKYHPKLKTDYIRAIYKRYFTLGGIFLGKIGLMQTPTESDLNKMAEAVFGACTMCGRCALACMQGVNNRRLVQLSRLALTEAGITPHVIQELRKNAEQKRHSYGLTFEESIGYVLSLARKHGVKAAIDRNGAEILGVCSAIGNTLSPDTSAEALMLLNAGKVNFTLSSRLKDTGTEANTTAVDLSLGRQLIAEVAEEAVRLGCKKILVGECGCDMRIYHIDAADILNKYGLEVVCLDGLLLDLIEEGRIAVSKLDIVATYHDPCWTGRLAGYFDISRRLLRKCVREFIELEPNREYNYCCNGGAGMLRMYPLNSPDGNLRRRVSILKAKQIEQAIQKEVEVIVTPCVTCHLSIKDIVSYYGLNIKVVQLGSVVLAAWKKARGTLNKQNDEELLSPLSSQYSSK